MTDEPEKNRGGEEDDGGEDDERPTAAPPFDPAAFAREVLGEMPESTPAPGQAPTGPGSDAPARRPLSTLNDPTEADESPRRRLPFPSPPPRRPTPAGALSLANLGVPSNVPPPTRRAEEEAAELAKGAVPSRKESLSHLNPVDSEWTELEVATRPPPAPDDPSQPSEADAPTRPPPAGDIDRLEALARGDQPSSRKDEEPTEQEMNDRVSLGDYTGALAIAERLLGADPENEVALACAENCRAVLRQMYTARIGPLDRVPLVMVPRDQLRWLSIDHRAGFVLSLVDGVSSLEMILDVSGMPELDALRILAELAQQRIISFR